MAGDQERLVVLLEARIRDFEKNMKKAEGAGTRSYNRLRRDSRSATGAMEADMVRSTGRINQALASTSAKIGTFGKAFAGGLVGGAVATAFAGLTSNIAQTVKGIASIGDEAKRAGVSLTAFQEWKFVAEQNHIGIDSMVDGLKELNLRADEFVVTGSGPAAEAFARLGYDAEQLKAALADPSALLLEIIGRMGELDKAAQIRVADEVFGGSAGERFVELIGQGEAGLRSTIERAHEVGAVLEDEMIAKAAELDRRFNELSTSAGFFFKTVAVNAADMAVDLTDLRAKLDELFRNPAQAEGLLGAAIKEELDADRDSVEQYSDELGTLRQQYEQVADKALAMVPALQQASATLEAWGYSDVSATLATLAAEMSRLVDGMRDGTVGAEEFETGISDVTRQAADAMSQLDSIDQAQFSGVIAAISGVSAALKVAAGFAAQLRAALPGGAPAVEDDERGGNTGNVENRATKNAPRTSPRPKAAPTSIDFGLPAIPTGGGGGGGGGGGAARADEYKQAATALREETAALEAEAVALLAVTQSDKDYGDALEYARKRAELLAAAQKAGKELTPELKAEVDQLAQAYVTAGLNAEDAADRLKKIEDNAKRGAEAISDIFFNVMTGATTAREAIAQLLLQMAQVQMQKAFLGAATANPTGILGQIGGLLGYASGGYTGNGGVNEPKGIVHGGEYVMSKVAVQRIGVGNLDAMHKAAKAGEVAAPQAAAAPVVNLKSVNVFDSADVLEKALANEAGQKVLINYMSRNSRAIRTALNR